MDTIRRTVSLRAHLSLLNKATSDKAEPTAGYHYDEICKLTFESVQICTDLEDYLLSRLRKKGPHTKVKCLKILKHLVENGHEAFVQDLQHRNEEIRYAQDYRGSMDPLHGDTFNAAVRDAAKKLMDSLFEHKNVSPRKPPDSRQTSVARDGFGNTGHGMDGSSGSAGVTEASFARASGGAEEGRMWGMGNPEFASTRKEPSGFMNKVKTKINQLAEHLPDSIVGKESAQSQGYQPAYDSHREMERSFRQNHDPSANPPAQTKPRAGLLPQRTGSSSGGGMILGSSPSSQNTGEAITRDTGYEKRLVADITAAGGVRAAPPQEDLDKFVTRCQSLDCHRVAEELRNAMDEAESDKQLLRALHVVVALANSQIVGIRSCLGCLDELVQELTTDDNRSVRKKASQLQAILRNTPTSSTASRSQQPPPAVMPATMTDAPTNLLDLDSDPTPAAPSSALDPLASLLDTNPAPAPVEQTGSLFANMSLGSAAAASTQPVGDAVPAGGSTGDLLFNSTAEPAAGNGLFSGMNIGTASSTKNDGTAASSTGGMFAGMSVGGQPATTPADTNSSGANLLDFGTSAPAPAPAQPTPSAAAGSDDLSALFGGNSATAAAPTTSSGLGFDGLLGGLGNGAPSAQQPMMAQPMTGQPMMGQPMLNNTFAMQQQMMMMQQQQMQMQMQGSMMAQPQMTGFGFASSNGSGGSMMAKSSRSQAAKSKADAFDFVQQELQKK